MLRLYTLLKRLFDIVGVKYIVERGEVDGWTYTKWNTGEAECECVLKKQTTAWTAWGSMFYANSFSKTSFPFAFTERPAIYTSIHGGATTFVLEDHSQPTTATSLGNFFPIAPIKPANSSVNLTLTVIAKGRWK